MKENHEEENHTDTGLPRYEVDDESRDGNAGFTGLACCDDNLKEGVGKRESKIKRRSKRMGT